MKAFAESTIQDVKHNAALSGQGDVAEPGKYDILKDLLYVWCFLCDSQSASVIEFEWG